MHPSPATCRYCFETIIYDPVDPSDPQTRAYRLAKTVAHVGDWICQEGRGLYYDHAPMDPLIQLAYHASRPGT